MLLCSPIISYITFLRCEVGQSFNSVEGKLQKVMLNKTVIKGKKLKGPWIGKETVPARYLAINQVVLY